MKNVVCITLIVSVMIFTLGDLQSLWGRGQAVAEENLFLIPDNDLVIPQHQNQGQNQNQSSTASQSSGASTPGDSNGFDAIPNYHTTSSTSTSTEVVYNTPTDETAAPEASTKKTDDSAGSDDVAKPTEKHIDVFKRLNDKTIASITCVLAWLGLITFVGLMAKLTAAPLEEVYDTFMTLAVGLIGTVICCVLLEMFYPNKEFTPLSLVGLLVAVVISFVILLIYRKFKLMGQRLEDALKKEQNSGTKNTANGNTNRTDNIITTGPGSNITRPRPAVGTLKPGTTVAPAPGNKLNSPTGSQQSGYSILGRGDGTNPGLGNSGYNNSGQYNSGFGTSRPGSGTGTRAGASTGPGTKTGPGPGNSNRPPGYN